MIARILFSLILAGSLGACVSETPAPSPLAHSSAISVSTPEFIISENTVLRWYSDLIWIDDPEGRFERRADMLQGALEREFTRKGYRFVAPGEPANYDVVAIALLGDIEKQEALEQIFHLYPSLGNASQQYDRGTVLVALAPAGTRTIVWRGALEIFTDPTMQPIAVRKQRMEWGARQVLGSIPSHP